MLSRIQFAASSTLYLAAVLGLAACSSGAGSEGTEVAPVGVEEPDASEDSYEYADAPEFRGFPEGSLESDLKLGDTGPDVELVYAFLNQYGYFPNKELAAREPRWFPVVDRHPSTANVFDDALLEAVTGYQRLNGLSATGIVSAETRKLMRGPRCAHPDLDWAALSHAQKWSIWPLWGDRKGTVRWWLDPAAKLPLHEFHAMSDDRYTAARLDEEVLYAIADAMRAWDEATPLSIVPASSAFESELTIRFGNDFTDIAQANPIIESLGYNIDDLIVMRSEYHWDTNPRTEQLPTEGRGKNLCRVIAHEVGHYLGLFHSSYGNAIMSGSGVANGPCELSADDKDGIGYVYGSWKPESGPTTSVRDIAQGQLLWAIGSRPTPSMAVSAKVGPGAAAVGSKSGEFWYIGSGLFVPTQSYPIYQKLANGNWKTIPGAATRIAAHVGAGPASVSDVPWVVDADGLIYRYAPGSEPPWERMPGNARDVSVSAASQVWIVSDEEDPSSPGDYALKSWSESGAKWSVEYDGSGRLYGRSVAQTDGGQVWVANGADGLLTRGLNGRYDYPLFDSSVARGSTPPFTWPWMVRDVDVATDTDSVWWLDADGRIHNLDFSTTKDGGVTDRTIEAPANGRISSFAVQGNEPLAISGGSLWRRVSGSASNGSAAFIPQLPSCGVADQSCCAAVDSAGVAVGDCLKGFACDNRTCVEAPCGTGDGAACCEGPTDWDRCPYMTSAQHRHCDDGLCQRCGNLDQVACGGTSCMEGRPDRRTAAGPTTCSDCGDLGDRCCRNATRTHNTFACSEVGSRCTGPHRPGEYLCTPCGYEGEPCCATYTLNSGGIEASCLGGNTCSSARVYLDDWGSYKADGTCGGGSKTPDGDGDGDDSDDQCTSGVAIGFSTDRVVPISVGSRTGRIRAVFREGYIPDAFSITDDRNRSVVSKGCGTDCKNNACVWDVAFENEAAKTLTVTFDADCTNEWRHEPKTPMHDGDDLHYGDFVLAIDGVCDGASFENGRPWNVGGEFVVYGNESSSFF